MNFALDTGKNWSYLYLQCGIVKPLLIVLYLGKYQLNNTRLTYASKNSEFQKHCSNSNWKANAKAAS